MNTENKILKGNGLTNIDEFMDAHFGKPGHWNVKDSVKKPVLM